MLIPCGVGLAAYYMARMKNGAGSKRWNQFLAGLGIAIVVVYVLRMFVLFPDMPPLNYNHQGMLPQIVDGVKEWVLKYVLHGL
jgi:cytochrome b561